MEIALRARGIVVYVPTKVKEPDLVTFSQLEQDALSRHRLPVVAVRNRGDAHAVPVDLKKVY